MFLLIDNYDSFTFNLVQAFQVLGVQPRVVRNDQPELLDLATDTSLRTVVISPGPGGPADSGLCLPFLQTLPSKLPVLGVCLGHQVLGFFAGCKVIRAERIMHGKTSTIEHDHSGLFQDLPNPFTATRYHSLLVNTNSVSRNGHPLRITARSEYQEPMALDFVDRPWFGIQFHPESILTPEGPRILENFLKLRVL